MNVEIISLWAGLFIVLAGVVVVALDVGALNRWRRQCETTLCRLWSAHAQVMEELVQLAETLAAGGDPEVPAGLDRLQRGMEEHVTGLQAMDAQLTEMDAAAADHERRMP
jgi:hypothetical protein